MKEYVSTYTNTHCSKNTEEKKKREKETKKKEKEKKKNAPFDP
jgi:hypothetical protein